MIINVPLLIRQIHDTFSTRCVGDGCNDSSSNCGSTSPQRVLTPIFTVITSFCCIHNSVSMLLSQVPHTVSVERRARLSTWSLLHRRCAPPLATLNAEAVLAEHGAAYEHLEECLLKQMSGSASSLPCESHVGMGALLRGAALTAAVMLSVADAAIFHGHLVPSGDSPC